MFNITFYEDRFEVSSNAKDLDWVLELTTDASAELPFQEIGGNQIKAEFRNFKYNIVCKEGTFKGGDTSTDYIFQITPANNKLVIDCTNQ